MLQRKLSAELAAWKNQRQETRKTECLLIKGARQVGKTFCVREFGKTAYASYIELNFYERPELATIFSGNLSSAEIKRRISLMMPHTEFISHQTLLFIDEIQECPAARTALKFLAQDTELDVIASGSLLGIAYKQADLASIPVGYERQLTLYPLDFEEFLWAKHYSSQSIDDLYAYLKTGEPVPQAIHRTMLDLVREYAAIGGMPAVVQRFTDTDNFGDAFDEQQLILNDYLDDIAKYAPNLIRAKSRACYLSIPKQLAKESTKFRYSVVEKQGTARKFEGALDWLEEANLVLPCAMVSTPLFPLAAYETDDKFKLYLTDTGLLCAMYGFEMLRAVVNDTLQGPMKGGFYENLVAAELMKAGKRLRYWRNTRGDCEIDFLLDGAGGVIPIEVKSKRGSTPSLNAVINEMRVTKAYKVGAMNLGTEGVKTTLPFYLAALMLLRA